MIDATSQPLGRVQRVMGQRVTLLCPSATLLEPASASRHILNIDAKTRISAPRRRAQ